MSEEAPITVAEIPKAVFGERVDRVVALLFGIPRSQVARLIEQGQVTIDGAPVRASHRVSEGTLGVALESTQVDFPQADASVQFDIIFEDETVIVVNKPAGLVVHPAPGARDHTLVNGLLAHDPRISNIGDPMRPGIVHRLDRDTSGLLVVARTQDAYEHLVGILARHEAKRVYLALSYGHFRDDHGVVDAPIGRDTTNRTRMAIQVNGRDARTAFEVLGRPEVPQRVSQLRCQLETGRTHQIRVHLAAIGHPVVGDRVYAARRPTFGLERTFLHAQQLEFPDARTGELRSFTAPLPADLLDWMAQYGMKFPES